MIKTLNLPKQTKKNLVVKYTQILIHGYEIDHHLLYSYGDYSKDLLENGLITEWGQSLKSKPLQSGLAFVSTVCTFVLT